MRIVLVLANPPLLQAAPEHHRATDLLSRGLQGALDGLAVALLLQIERRCTEGAWKVGGGGGWWGWREVSSELFCLSVCQTG